MTVLLVSTTALCDTEEYFVTETPRKLKNAMDIIIPRAQNKTPIGLTNSFIARIGSSMKSYGREQKFGPGHGINANIIIIMIDVVKPISP